MSLAQPEPRSLSKGLWFVMAAGASFSLAPYLVLALHAFPSADDYCLAVETRLGFWAMQAFFYAEWTGRYTAMFIQALVSEGDLAGVYPWFCVATLSATLFATRAVVQAVLDEAVSGRTSWLAAAVATAVLAGNLPSSTEAYFWMSSAISYQWGLIAYLCLVSLFVRSFRSNAAESWATKTALVVLAAMLPGFSEVMLPLVLAAMTSLVVAFRVHGRPTGRFVLAIVALTLAGMAISLLAPGNGVRSASYPDIPSRHNLAFAAVETLRQSGRFLATHVSAPAVWAAALAAWWWAPPGLAFRLTRLSPRRACSVVLGLLVLVYATLFPLYWEYGAVNYTGEGRTYNLTFLVFALAMAVGIWGLLTAVAPAPSSDGRRRLDWAVAVALVVSMIGSPATLQALRTSTRAPAYLAAQQARERVLRATHNDGARVRVPRVRIRAPGLHWADLQTDRKHWINRCVADYYGLESVGTYGG